jgi:hypothetical protein
MHHPSAVCVVEVVAGLVQHPVVIRSAVPVHDEDPAEVRVASYTSSLRFKDKAIDTPSIGRELTVSWLLEGSVRSRARW